MLDLPAANRARLAEVLLASLDTPKPSVTSADVEVAWRLESERRLAELHAGTVVGVPADEVFRRIERRLEL